MSPNMYNFQNINVNEAFKRIDNFLMENPINAIDNHPVLNENDIRTIKILISDLTALDGLKPKELQKREQIVFKLISMLSLYYLSQADEINVMDTFFLVPEKT